MSFINSSPVRVPLSDPMSKYGKTFRVSNVYLSSSSQPQIVKNLEPSSNLMSTYGQNFETRFLSISWNVIDPRNGYEYVDSSEIENNKYVSGFNVDIYKNFGNLTGQNGISRGEKVFSSSGIKGNSVKYIITGDEDCRNYSVQIALVDFTGNQSAALLTTQNPEPVFLISSSGIDKGKFYCSYQKPTGDQGEDTSNGMEALTVYNFTGLESGTFPGIDKSERSFVSNNGEVTIELTPGCSNYLMCIASDKYSSGSVGGFFQEQEYYTGAGFTGYIGDPKKPMKIDFFPEFKMLSGSRASGADAYLYNYEANYDRESDLVSSYYSVTGTGQTTGSVSGYSGSIFFDTGKLFDSEYDNDSDSGFYIYDNSLSIQSGFHTGELTEVQVITGEGVTGSGTYGSGAGGYWSDGFPKYTGYKQTGGGGFVISGGVYSYGYFDSNKNTFKCATYEEIKSGAFEPSGIYSMPKNKPNSYDIQYHSGPNFQETYEQSASFLNYMDRMPAVVLNKSQLSKIIKMQSGVGWLGLRRNKVSLITDMFSQGFDNQSFFKSLNLNEESSREISIINSSGQQEDSFLEVSDVGEDWCWVNSSGSEIYKYAGSGYDKSRTADISLCIKRNKDGKVIHETGFSAVAPQMKIEEIVAESGNQSLTLNYKFENEYYISGGTNYNIVQMGVYGGEEEDFVPGQGNLMKNIYLNEDHNATSLQSQVFINITGLQSIPQYFKMIPYDTIGSGFAADINELAGAGGIKTSSKDQITIISLDELAATNQNCIEVDYKFSHPSDPVVTFGLNYTGDKDDDIAYIGAMIAGNPSRSSVRFVLTDPPPGTGYALNVRSFNQ
jgi:hypothetical protein